MHVCLIPEGASDPTVMRGAMFGVTARRRVEHDLEEQAYLFEAVFNHVPIRLP